MESSYTAVAEVLGAATVVIAMANFLFFWRVCKVASFVIPRNQ